MPKKCVTFFFIICLPLACLALTEISNATADFHAQEFSGLRINLLPPLKPEGVFHVHCFVDRNWQYVGKMEFDRFLREQSLMLPSTLTGSNSLRVLLVEEGGGAAHIDAVSFEGNSPDQVEGVSDTNLLEKISKVDNELADAFDRALEIVFPPPCEQGKLRLTARIENQVISETPFLFPPEIGRASCRERV